MMNVDHPLAMGVVARVSGADAWTVTRRRSEHTA
jgi:hypothetical protein